MSKTITSAQLSGYVLSAAANPLSITSTGAVKTNGGTAIYGSSAQAWTITNDGTVSGGNVSGSLGIDLKAGGLISNTGLISGYHYSIRMHGAAGTVVNSGTISSHKDGVVLFNGGRVTNAAGGQIVGTTNVGVYISGGAATFTNAGTVEGGIDAVQFVGDFDDQLIFDAGAVFTGNVAGGTGDNTLELAAHNGTAGTLSNFGSQFTGFGTLNVDTRANWTVNNTDTFGSGVTITVDGVLINTGSIGTYVTVASGGTLDNRGSIISSGFAAVYLSGGLLVNEAGATVSAVGYGVIGQSSADSVSNAGAISGVELTAGGTVDNLTGATISGTGYGVTLGAGGLITATGHYGARIAGAGTVENAGTISGQSGLGVSGGSVTNASGGLLEATELTGLTATDSAETVTNAGTIEGRIGGVALRDGGSVSNAAGASIVGTITDGVYVDGAGTVTNAGTVTGESDAILFSPNVVADRVVFVPGAVFNGKIIGGNGGNSLELAPGATAGTLSIFATQFTNFSSIIVDAGANWTIGNTETIGSGVTVTVDGTLINTAPISAYVTVASGGTLDNRSSIISTGSTAVSLLGGTLVNEAGATISAATYGVFGATAAGSVSNAGSIFGLELTAGGTVDNLSRGVISGVKYGVYLTNGGFLSNASGGLITTTGNYGAEVNDGSVTNSGTIRGESGLLVSGGPVSNTLRGLLDGSMFAGLILENASQTLTNSGTIEGSSGGVVLFGGGSVTNAVGGRITSANGYGIDVESLAGTITNYGLISSAATKTDYAAVGLFAGGSVSNAAGGVISAAAGYGVYITGSAGTVTNAGTISSDGDAVYFTDDTDRLIVDPGAVFIGTVVGAAGALELAQGDGATGTLSALGTQFTDFQTIDVDAAASWKFDGTDTADASAELSVAGTLANTGSIGITLTVVTGGLLDNFGTVSQPVDVRGLGPMGGGAVPGVGLLGGGVVNESGAQIFGYDAGVYGLSSPGTVTNSGEISGGKYGVELYGGGSVTNLAGSIWGPRGAVRINGGIGSVDNAGLMYGYDGVVLLAGGSISNAAGGTIIGSVNAAAYIGGGAGTITNAGTLTGAADAVQFSGDFADRLIDDPGAVFNGNVVGGSGSNTLELALGDGATGTLSRFGSQFTGFGTTVVDAGASWKVNSTDTIAAAVAALIDAGTLTNTGSIGVTVTVVSGGQFDNFSAVGAAATDGVLLTGGTVVNEAGGSMHGSDIGVYGSSTAGTVSNAGNIDGLGGGVVLTDGGSVTNLANASISALIHGYGVKITGATGVVTDAGYIGGPDGVALFGGGSVSNAAGGVISGVSNVGVYINGGTGTVTNAGTISGATYAVQFIGGYPDRLIVDPGAVFDGTVAGNEGGDTLELAQGDGATGTLTNFGSQIVQFGTIDVDEAASWVVDNTDTTSPNTTFDDSGTLTNTGSMGAEVTVGRGDLFDNFGSISAGGLPGVALTGGTLVNEAGGFLQGFGVGVTDSAGAGKVSNDGYIGGGNYGIALAQGGSVTNLLSGSIYGNDAAIKITGGSGAVSNAGSLNGQFGVAMYGGGSISNALTGYIYGNGNAGAYISGGTGTITNAGYIGGTTDAVQFVGDFSDRLIVDPGASFYGAVVGGGGTNTLELAQGSSSVIGTLTSFGSQFTGFGAIKVDAGATWAFDASDTLGAVAVNDAGSIQFSDAQGATLTEAATITGTGDVTQLGAGTLLLDGNDSFSGGITIGGGTLELSAGNAAGAGPIIFDGDPTLKVDGEVMPTGTLHGLAAGDQIDLAGAVFTNGGTAPIVNGNTLRVIENSDTYDLTLNPAGSFSTLSFVETKDAGTGTLITLDAACYGAGTRILTVRGEVAVEHLVAGDQVVTASGRVRPVRWIGHRHLDLDRHPAPDRVAPIRIRADAFADGVPSRDLLLSPDHAVQRDGVLIPVGLLRNGASITRETRRGKLVYYHVELDAHDILLAENLAAESYLDTGNRDLFENSGGPIALHPNLAADQARREAESCLPFADNPARVEPVWRELAARAERLGWRLPPEPETTEDPALRVLLDGQPSAPISSVDGRYVFVLPRGAREPGALARLVSRRAVPSDTAPWISDRRQLGVMLSSLRLHVDGSVVVIPLDHPDLDAGWWQPEWHGRNELRRWTNGDAVVPMPKAAPEMASACLLEVECGTVRYPLPAVVRAETPAAFEPKSAFGERSPWLRIGQ